MLETNQLSTESTSKTVNEFPCAMEGVEVEYLRMGGHGVQGRWYLEAWWEGRAFHIEFQPSTFRFSRAGTLGCDLNKNSLGTKISDAIRPETLRLVVEDISGSLRAIGPNSRLRRSEGQIQQDMSAFIASVVLQNTHPDAEIIQALVKRTKAYLERGLFTASPKNNIQWSFGSNAEGWWYMREVPPMDL